MKEFIMWEVRYIPTGTGENRGREKWGRVNISTGDEYGGKRVFDLFDVFDAFEWIAANNWGTYENRRAVAEVVEVYRAKM